LPSSDNHDHLVTDLLHFTDVAPEDGHILRPSRDVPKRILTDINPSMHKGDVGGAFRYVFRIGSIHSCAMIGQEVRHFVCRCLDPIDARQIIPDADFSPRRMLVGHAAIDWH